MQDKLRTSGESSDGQLTAKKIYQNAKFSGVPIGVAICSSVCIIFLSISIGSHDWSVGSMNVKISDSVTEVHPVFVGLFSAYSDHSSIAWKQNGGYAYLSDLCADSTGQEKEIWCAASSAGTAAASLIWLAYIAQWVATALTLILGLQQIPQLDSIKSKIPIPQELQQNIVLSMWAGLWFLIFLALVVYSSSVPDTYGYSTVRFDAGFGLARLSFLITSLSTGILLAKWKNLADESQMVEAVDDFKMSPPIRKACYVCFFVQIACYLFVTVDKVEWQVLTCFFGLYYLDTEKKNFLLMYLVASLTSILFDIMSLSGQPEMGLMSATKQLVVIVSTLILLLKFAILVLLGLIIKYDIKSTLNQGLPETTTSSSMSGTGRASTDNPDFIVE